MSIYESAENTLRLENFQEQVTEIKVSNPKDMIKNKLFNDNLDFNFDDIDKVSDIPETNG